MHDQLQALEELSRTDVAYRQIDVELADVDAQLSRLRSDVDKIRELLDRERSQLADTEKMWLSQQAEIEAITEKTARSKKRAELARNAREADATARELEVLKREREERSAEAERLAKAISDVKASIERHEADFGELTRLLEAEAQSAAEQTQELRQRKSAMEAERKLMMTRVRADLMRIYTMVFTRRGSGVAECVGGVCRGCNVTLPPQLYNQVVLGDKVYQCPNCQRLLLPPKTAARTSVP